MSWGRSEGTGRSGNLFSHILPLEIRNGSVGRMAAAGTCILMGRMCFVVKGQTKTNSLA